MKRSFNLIIIITFLALDCLAQSSSIERPKYKDVRLDEKKPSIYLAFEKMGERKPLYQGESVEGIWLRLNNNTKWGIYFCAGGAEKEYGDYTIFYKVERLPAWRWKIKDVDIPIGYRPGHICNVIELKSGKSVLFSIPREHLAEGLVIRVEYNYSWERYGDVLAGREPEHRVYFSSTELPSKK